ncbi:MAG: GNAT family N-acetyltransferase [Lachnospiraceae bacterium]|nr:GNAT family N-acetyltransferase [Lachnospiraceae bacterium]HBV82530.1 N-acetyltransferase [Lachnospiraceae bacterium]
MGISKTKLHLRQVCLADRELLFEWANDDTVRANAFHTEKIPYTDHIKWFANIMTKDSIYQYILCDNELPVGQIRLNIEGDKAFIDYSIAAKYRGMGYGTTLMQLFLQELETVKMLDKRTLVGQVKQENLASARVFEKCGFTPIKKKDVIQYELVWRH